MTANNECDCPKCSKIAKSNQKLEELLQVDTLDFDVIPITKVWPFCLYRHLESVIANAISKNLIKENDKIDPDKLMLLLAKIVKTQVKIAIDSSGESTDDFYR